MPVTITETTIENILTRTTGYLRTVSSHSLQPYRGCTFGHALCGVGCYVQHNQHLVQGREWGGFLEIRTNAAASYVAHVEREARWARREGRRFSIFCSSATDPFVPQEFRHGITRSILTAMLEQPPDELILQTHSHRASDYGGLLRELADRCDLRVHLSIETDRERIPGLPPHASSVEHRLEACARLRQAGLRVVVTVSPLLPIADPERFFARIAEVADAVVLDHFIQGDGSSLGQRTLRTRLPEAMAALEPVSVELAYRDAMVHIAQRHLPGRVGVNIDGFAGRYLPASV
ncbi:MAG TPA: radical SAM protein [Planctomycetaceae bacterium]|nr:radical SAM protein [Planctomycetaceae bacterium]